MPTHFKTYTIQDKKVLVEMPKREKPKKMVESYHCSKDAKRVDLAFPREEPHHVYITDNLEPQEEELLVTSLQNNRDVFAWSYKYLKGVDPYYASIPYP